MTAVVYVLASFVNGTSLPREVVATMFCIFKESLTIVFINELGF
jgi:hypothetical protein